MILCSIHIRYGMSMRWHGLLWMGCVACVALIAMGCDPVDWDTMKNQPRYEPYETSELQTNNTSAQTPPVGTVSRTPVPGYEQSKPAQIDMTLLQRGQRQFNINCTACHGEAGYGNGMVVRRGFPQPPSFHEDRLRQAPDRYLYEVITHGRGKMNSYGDQVAPRDRHAIIAYIRALQLSQHADLSQVPTEQRYRLNLDGQDDRPIDPSGAREVAP